MTLKEELQTLVDKGVLLITIRSSSIYRKEIKEVAYRRMIGNVLGIPREKESPERRCPACGVGLLFFDGVWVCLRCCSVLEEDSL